MAACFAVPTKCDTEKRTKLLGNLKCLVATLEDELTPKVEPVCYTPVCLTSCVPCCPPQVCCPPQICCPPQASTPKPPEAPDILVCYKCKTNGGKKQQRITLGKELGESKSRELRGGILHIGCDCEKKNGLQDDCQRTGCHGSPQCLTSPPTCLPSQYCNGKHLTKRRNKQAKNCLEDGGNDDEQESFTYQCYSASVKVPDQKICVITPTLCCPPKYDC